MKSNLYLRNRIRRIKYESGDPRYPTTHFVDQKEVRKVFWEMHPHYSEFFREKKTHNKYKYEIRKAFVDFVNELSKAGCFSEYASSVLSL